MNSRLDVHVAAYEGKNIYDFDNEISLTWYPKRIARVVKDPRAVLDLGLGHGFATEIFSGGPGRHVVLEGSRAVICARMNQCHLVIHAWSLALKDRGPARVCVMPSESGPCCPRRDLCHRLLWS